MARIKHDTEDRKRHTRSQSKNLVKDFERQYIARNKDPHIYL